MSASAALTCSRPCFLCIQSVSSCLLFVFVWVGGWGLAIDSESAVCFKVRTAVYIYNIYSYTL